MYIKKVMLISIIILLLSSVVFAIDTENSSRLSLKIYGESVNLVSYAAGQGSPDLFFPSLNLYGVQLIYSGEIGDDFRLITGIEAGMPSVYADFGFSKEFFFGSSKTVSLELVTLAYLGADILVHPTDLGMGVSPVFAGGIGFSPQVNFNLSESFILNLNGGIRIGYTDTERYFPGVKNSPSKGFVFAVPLCFGLTFGF